MATKTNNNLIASLYRTLLRQAALMMKDANKVELVRCRYVEFLPRAYTYNSTDLVELVQQSFRIGEASEILNGFACLKALNADENELDVLSRWRGAQLDDFVLGASILAYSFMLAESGARPSPPLFQEILMSSKCCVSSLVSRIQKETGFREAPFPEVVRGMVQILKEEVNISSKNLNLGLFSELMATKKASISTATLLLLAICRELKVDAKVVTPGASSSSLSKRRSILHLHHGPVGRADDVFVLLEDTGDISVLSMAQLVNMLSIKASQNLQPLDSTGFYCVILTNVLGADLLSSSEAAEAEEVAERLVKTVKSQMLYLVQQH